MKKIGVIVPYYEPPFLGGTETVLKTWNKYFNEHDENIDVSFMVPFKQKGDFIFGKITNKHLVAPGITNSKKVIKALGFLFLILFLARTSVDEVVVLSPKYIRLSNFVKAIFHKNYKVISWMHFSLSTKFTNDSRTFRTADYHLAISSGIKNQLLDMGVPESQISVIFNPVSRQKRTIKQSVLPSFLFVGRLEMKQQKNIGELIQGFHELRETEAGFRDAKLTVVGDGADREVLESLVGDYGEKDNVEFVGWKSDPFSEISSATALVLTSKYEGLPMVLLESISYGLPVVSSDIETGPSDIINRNNGLLYDSGDIQMLAKQLMNIYLEKLNEEHVKESVHDFYDDGYFSRVVSTLNRI